MDVKFTLPLPEHVRVVPAEYRCDLVSAKRMPNGHIHVVLDLRDEILTLEQAADYVDVTTRTLQDRIRDGALVAIALDERGMPWAIRASDLDAMIMANPVKPEEE